MTMCARPFEGDEPEFGGRKVKYVANDRKRFLDQTGRGPEINFQLSAEHMLQSLVENFMIKLYNLNSKILIRNKCHRITQVLDLAVYEDDP